MVYQISALSLTIYLKNHNFGEFRDVSSRITYDVRVTYVVLVC